MTMNEIIFFNSLFYIYKYSIELQSGPINLNITRYKISFVYHLKKIVVGDKISIEDITLIQFVQL